MSDTPQLLLSDSGPAQAVEYGPLNPRSHPFLPSPTPAEIDAAMGSTESAAEYIAFYKDREERIRRSEAPGLLLEYAFEPECWHDFDRDLADAKTEGRDYGGIYVGGGKRSTKSSCAACRVTQSALTYGNGIVWCLQREMKISVITQQRMLWEWFPEKVRRMNDQSGKRKGNEHTKIRYSLDAGFTEGNVVLPNGTMLMFLSYKMDPRDYQGAEIGARIARRTARVGEWPWIARVDANGVAYYKNGLPVPNIGAWLDEDAPAAWVSTVRDRLTTRNAKFIWTFTTENGVTRAVKDTLGAAANIETRAAEDMLPQERVLVKGCKPGHVPYRQRTTTPGVNAIFFHTRFNVFGDNYPNMAARYRGKDEAIVLANIYGYSEEIHERAYPLFGAWNVIDDDALPAEGTNYLLCDPAGSRNFAFIWVRIAPGCGKEDWFFYDEWPDAQRYGAWAVPDDSQEPNPDGLAGPAQRNLGWGIERYKQLILDKERIAVPAELFTTENTEHTELSAEAEQRLVQLFPDPMKRRLARAALENGPDFTEPPSLPIRERYLDPRAAASPSQEQKGARTLLDKFRDETRDAEGRITGPRMLFKPAPGLDVQTGIASVQQLLYFNDKEEIIRGFNSPRLFVTRRCRQLIWMFENYTSTGGESAGCKDFADLVRYAVTSRLRYISPGAVKTTGGGSY